MKGDVMEIRSISEKEYSVSNVRINDLFNQQYCILGKEV